MIRAFEDADLTDIISIWLNGNKQAHPFIHEDYWVSNIGLVSKELPRAEVYVYEKLGKIMAFIGLQGDYIAGLFVDKKYRSKGIGHELISFAKHSRNGLTLSVYEKNTKALRFYLKEGFKITATRLDIATGEREHLMSWQDRG